MDTDIILRLLGNGQNKSECQKILSEAALDDTVGLSVQTAAVYYLSDENLLKKIAFNAKKSMVKISAIDKIRDNEFLKNIFYPSNNGERIAILKNLGNEEQDFFKKVATNSHLFTEVRMQALKKICDDDFIFENFIAKECNAELERAAVTLITNVEMVKAIARSNLNPRIRLQGIQKLDVHDKTLEDIALNDDNINIRKAAIERYQDLATDIIVALYNKSEESNTEAISIALLNKMQWETCGKILIFIATSHPNKVFRQLAVSKVFDEAILRDIALNETDSVLRKNAIRNLSENNQALFEKLMKDTDYFVRYEVVQKITNIETLMFVVETEYSTDIKEIALRKLKGYNHFLGGIVKKFSSTNTYIAAEALKMIKDVDVLAKLKEDSSISWVLRAYIVTA